MQLSLMPISPASGVFVATQRSETDGDAERRFDPLHEAVSLVLNSEPAAAAFRNVQKNLDDVEDDRNVRLGAAQGGVPPYPASLLLLSPLLFMVEKPCGGSLHARSVPLQRTLGCLAAR